MAQAVMAMAPAKPGPSLAALGHRRARPLPTTSRRGAVKVAAAGGRGATRIQRLIEEEGIVLMPGCYDALSAAILQKTGFSAGFISGYALSASHLGKPDFGLLTPPEMAATARFVCAAAPRIPIIADADTGGGNALNVQRTVQDLIAAGAAGCFLEDQAWPKKCGHMRGKQVIPAEEHAAKIASARDAIGDADFFLVARTDARATSAKTGLSEAIARANLYMESRPALARVLPFVRETVRVLRSPESSSSCAPRRPSLLAGVSSKRLASLHRKDMTSETQISSVNGFTEILMWNQTRLTYLTELLVEHHHVEKRASTRWKSEGWETIRAEFNTRFGLNVTIKQLKDRVQVMKNDYVVIKNISNTSGFDFNPMLKNFVATDDVWDAYIQKHPEARIWRGVAIPLYNEWYEMFEPTIADGSRQRNTLAPTETIELNDPYMTPPHETHVVLTKDDGSLASSLDVKHKMGKEPVNLVDKKKRRSSKEPSSTFAEAMVEAIKELKKTSIPPSYKMIQQCVKLIMVMDLTISEKARAADLIRKDNAYLVFLKFDEATRLEWLKMHFGDL